MRIANIHIKGFRNFDDEKITFQDKTLIIGANDVGKTNLIYALRLLFDKSISEDIYSGTDNDLCDYWDQHENENEWTYKTDPPAIATNLNSSIRTQAVSYGLHVSDVDLETDLANSPLKGALRTHYNKRTVNTLVKAMQTKKAENMMHFLSQNHDALSCLVDDNIVLPLSNLKIKVEERIHPTND